MANDNAPRGLEPIKGPGGNIPANEYPLYASCATAVYLNDPVDKESGGTVTLATAGANHPVLGSVIGIFDTTGLPVNYAPASPGSGYTLIVADDPHQEFELQEDGDTDDLELADRNINVDLVAGSGSTSTGLSGWMINSNTEGASASKQLRLIRKVDKPNNALGDYCRWIVRINNHRNSPGIVGVGV